MGKLALGFILGVVVTALLLLQLDTDDSALAGRVLEPAAPRQELGRGEAADAAGTRTDTETASREGPDIPLPSDPVARAAALRQAAEDAFRAAGEYAAELRRIEIEQWRTSEPVITHVTLPAEFDWLAETDYRSAYDIIQREPVDAAWAALAEAHIRSYFSNHPELTNRFGWPTVHCGSTRCLSAFVVTRRDDSPEAANQIGEEFIRQVADFYELPGPLQFASRNVVWRGCHGSCAQSHKQGRVTTIVWTLLRKQE